LTIPASKGITGSVRGQLGGCKATASAPSLHDFALQATISA
jgi:hypothetical protein